MLPSPAKVSRLLHVPARKSFLAGLLAAALPTFVTIGTGVAVFAPALASGAPTATLTTLHRFTAPVPLASLIKASDGNFYGTTSGGGAFGYGSVISVTPAGAVMTFYSFRGNDDGSSPQANLIQGNDGNFYGTASAGGLFDRGTVFQLTQDGTLTTLHHFGDPNATVPDGYPHAALLQSSDGSFYGTTSGTGTPDVTGSIYKITASGIFTTLHTFASGEGYYPLGNLATDPDGNLYGTTFFGPSGPAAYPPGYGSVFKMTPSGGFTTLHAFKNTDGGQPMAGLIRGADDNFYGTASRGGGDGSSGEVFQITPNGTFSLLHSFRGDAEGDFPSAGIIQGSNGNFYGTTLAGGIHGGGTVFQLTPAGAYTVLYSFFSPDGPNDSHAALLEDDNGDFYGTLSSGGPIGGGAVFKITPAGVLTTLTAFADTNLSAPLSALVAGTDGNLYGTDQRGGNYHKGSVFRVAPDGSETTLYSFDQAVYPAGGLTPSTDGGFYGTTFQGGAKNAGTLFHVDMEGNFAILYEFDPGTSGIYPNGPLILDGAGNLFGVTVGTAGNAGSIFEYSAGGVFTTLHNFQTADGASPQGGLVRDTNSNFYGVTSQGGANGDGTIFRSTPAGIVTSLHSFDGADGTYPIGPLALGADGNFYGNTYAGGANGAGTIFRITASGDLTILHHFGSDAQDGSSPKAGLLQGMDGNFYGSTFDGGAFGYGTLFQLTPTGVYTTIHSFDLALNPAASNGTHPGLTLTELSNGVFYGVTDSSIFRFTFLPVIGSPLEVVARAEQPFSYQISATNDPTSFGASGLPAGLSLNASSGVISGTPTQTGNFNVTLTAAHGNKAGSATLLLIVKGPLPVITSNLNPPSRQGVAFAYQITATNNPTSYAAADLPPGLSINQTTGKISGTPTASGNFTVKLTATNAEGPGTANLNLVIKPLQPVITSDLNPASRQGVAFAYQIMATNNPTSYGAAVLPGGLTLNQSTGKITGSPSHPGTFTVTIAAFNSGGSGSAKLNLVIKQAVPVITSSLNAASQQGVAFTYQITATNAPTSYGASGLPSGLTINQGTGKITGTPTVNGTFNVTVAAFNSGGSGSARVNLVIKKAEPPVITSSLNPPSRQGVAFGYQITANNNPTSYAAQGLPGGLGLSTTTGRISGTPTKAGNYTVTIKATNSGGTGTATLTVVVKPPV